MAGLLEGLRVVDMGQVIAIPSAGAMLADWGADVIKVEPPTGDQHRRRVGPSVMTFDRGTIDWRIEMANRNKKGLALDLKKDSGREIIYRLIQRADIFMSNYEVSTLNKLGLDYPTLSQLNPRLIYAIITGFGTEGPDKDERGFAISGWARSGAQYLQTEPGGQPPPIPAGMIDRVAASDLVAGILAALLYRERTGKGQKLETSLYQSTIWAIATNIQGALVGQELPKSVGTKTRGPLGNVFQTKDGYWLQLAMLVPTVDKAGFFRTIERPELADDPRFNAEETEEQHREELNNILEETFASKDVAEWEKRFKANNVIYVRAQSPLEVTTDPQALANNFFSEIQHPIAGKMKLVNTPVRFHQNPAKVKTPAPEIGQHTEEILLELGYSRDDIARFKEEGVIR